MVFVPVVYSERHHREIFDKCVSWHTSVPLELVHSDLCGPLPSTCFSGFKYFLTFIDDYSKSNWVYFLKLKSEVFNMFFSYKALVEKQSGHQIIMLISDNGAEYVKKNSLLSALNKESNNNTLFHIHHNKMV